MDTFDFSSLTLSPGPSSIVQTTDIWSLVSRRILDFLYHARDPPCYSLVSASVCFRCMDSPPSTVQPRCVESHNIKAFAPLPMNILLLNRETYSYGQFLLSSTPIFISYSVYAHKMPVWIANLAEDTRQSFESVILEGPRTRLGSQSSDEFAAFLDTLFSSCRNITTLTVTGDCRWWTYIREAIYRFPTSNTRPDTNTRAYRERLTGVLKALRDKQVDEVLLSTGVENAANRFDDDVGERELALFWTLRAWYPNVGIIFWAKQIDGKFYIRASRRGEEGDIALEIMGGGYGGLGEGDRYRHEASRLMEESFTRMLQGDALPRAWRFASGGVPI